MLVVIIESSPFQLPLNMKMVSVMFFLTRILLATFSLAGLVGSDTFTVGYLAGIILDIKEHASAKNLNQQQNFQQTVADLVEKRKGMGHQD